MIKNMKIKILFVCLGNICRSPSAEAIFRGYVEKKGLAKGFEIDSAGTSAYHQGEPADARMRQACFKAWLSAYFIITKI